MKSQFFPSLLYGESDASLEKSFDIVSRAHAYQCVGARDEVPGSLRVSTEFLSEAAGGEALPILTDVRDEAQVKAAVAQTAEKFGGVDIELKI